MKTILDFRLFCMYIYTIDTGLKWYRQVLFDNRVQQRLSMSCTKDSTNQDGDNSLDGLVIDWHLATSEMVSNDFVEPVSNYEPTYAYA